MRSTLTFTIFVLVFGLSAKAALHKVSTHNAADIVLQSISNQTTIPIVPKLAGEGEGADADADDTDGLVRREDYYDDDGNIIEFFDDGGDAAGEDEEANRIMRRRRTGRDCDKSDRKHRIGHRKGKGHPSTHRTSHKIKHKALGHSTKHRITSPSASEHGQLLSKKILITWYASQDLLHPACGTGSWNPTSNSHIGAISTNWKDGPACGDFIDLCNEATSPKKCITVRRVDDCAGCDEDHVDLTKAAFKALSPSGGLDEGIVRNLKMYKTKKANPWNLSLFGPFALSIW